MSRITPILRVFSQKAVTSYKSHIKIIYDVKGTPFLNVSGREPSISSKEMITFKQLRCIWKRIQKGVQISNEN